MPQQTDQVDDGAATAAATEAEQEANERAAAQAEEAALLAGFAEASGQEPPTPTDEETTAGDTAGPQDKPDNAAGGNAPGTTDQPSNADDAAATAAAQADTPLTRAQLDEILAQERAAHQAELRKLHGRYGQLNGRIEDLAKRKGLTKEDLAALREEGWDDVADALGRNLPDKHEDLPPLEDATDDTPATQPAGASNAVELPPEVQDRYLDRLSPGWQTKIISDDFANWLRTLPANEAEAIADSKDPIRIADEIGRFDQWKSAAAARAAEDEKAERLKQRRLSGAAPPTRGTTTATIPAEDDEEAAMLKGYASVRGGR